MRNRLWGLTVVWNVVLDHDGYINVISDERGAKFEPCFPVTREEAIIMQSSPSLESLKGNREMILVIDDLKSQREISCRMQKAVIVSGFAETEMVKETRKMGAGRYLKKPFILEDLGLAVKEELAKQPNEDW